MLAQGLLIAHSAGMMADQKICSGKCCKNFAWSTCTNLQLLSKVRMLFLELENMSHNLCHATAAPC